MRDHEGAVAVAPPTVCAATGVDLVRSAGTVDGAVQLMRRSAASEEERAFKALNSQVGADRTSVRVLAGDGHWRCRIDTIEEATQRCRTCGEVKAVPEFDVRADSGKPNTQCKGCRRAYQNERDARLCPRIARTPRLRGTLQMLLCTRCHQMTPSDQFPPKRRGGAQLQTWCRACFAEVNARRYVQKHTSELERLGRNLDANRRANQAAVLAYLREHPCVDCGESDTVVLEFDHLIGKRKDVSALLNSGATWPSIQREISKCQVRCANCHRIRTGQRAVLDSTVIQLELSALMYVSQQPVRETPPDGTETRACRKCGGQKPLIGFAFRCVARGTRVRICRECQSEYQRAWYERSREKQIRRSRRRRRQAKRTRVQVRQRMWQHLLSHPCIDCGETDPRVLDFDHLRDKRAEVGALVRAGASWTRVLEEIAKCQVRCANCHRRRTMKEAGSYRTKVIDRPAG